MDKGKGDKMGNRKIFFVTFIGIIFITFWSICSSLGYFDSKEFIAKDGVLSLHNWDADKDGMLKLDGEWDFYPNELIIPNLNEDVFGSYKDIHKYIPVPKSWDNYLSEPPTQYGVGTYRLLIQVPIDGQYGIKLNTIRNSSTVFINGVELGSAGVPSKNQSEYRFDFRKYVVLKESQNKQLEIVVLVANKDYATGGIVNSIHFGTADQILAKQSLHRLVEAFVISGYILFSVIYIAAYFQHKKNNLYELYFSLFCLSEGVYVSTVNERWISLIFPGLHPTVQVELQMLALGLSLLFFLLFLSRFFISVASKKIVFALSLVFILQSLVFLVAIPSIDLFQYIPFRLVQLVVSCTALIGYIYTFSVLAKASVQKMDESEYVLIGVLSYVAYGLLLGIELLFEVEIGSPSLILFLIIVMSLSLLMSHRSQQAFYKVEELSEELLVYDKLKDEFLAKTSHELSTPLHGIINLSQSLMEGVEGPLKKQQQESVILIHSVGKRLANVVKDLLFVSKIKEGKISIAPRPLHIRIVEEVLAEMEYLMPPTRLVKLINEIPKNLPLVYVDEQKLKQIIFNLLYNAIKFTEHGTITISAKILDEQMHISIQDTGRGIAKEHYDLIFSTFYQVESTKSGESKGLGLGLSITKKIVEESGGRIWVSSEVGKGSCFTFTMPLATDQQLQDHLDTTTKVEPAKTTLPKRKIVDQQQLEKILPTKIKGTKPSTILVVDDEPANLKVLMNAIQSLQYNLIAVSSGQEALEALKTETIDLMILDLMMPNMTGYEVCRIVREEYDLVELPVIILTAAGHLSDLVVSFQLGANDYLQKPVNLEELKVRVESLLLMKKSAQEAINDELSFFHAQITPHFLYNTFNTIIGLSYSDAEKTREALEHLATYFRAKLNFQNHRSLVSLGEEMELVEAYLAIEQLRFGERLKIEYNIDKTIDTLIPTLTIQPLVENAVQHGISKNKDGGTLRLTIERELGNVKVVIEDDGNGITQEKQQKLLTGKNDRLGFINPFNKLSLIKGTSFQLISEEGKGTKITIRIPEVKNNENTTN